MITGTTSQGFKFKVNEKLLNDWRFVKAIRRSESDDQGERLLGVTDIIYMLLGEEQSDKLAEHIAEQNNGIAPVDSMYKAVIEILNICKEKNEKIKK